MSYPEKPGYTFVGCVMFFRHWRTGQIVRSKDGKPIPIYRKNK